jgi:hypothetical protein
VRAQVSARRAGRYMWTQDACLLVRKARSVPGLRRGDQLVVRILSDAGLYSTEDLHACSGNALGGTITVRS